MQELQDHAIRDYTIHNGIGIRVKGSQACQVIRLVRGQWVEIGNEYSIPVDPSALCWTPTGIPATVLSVALRVYELDHPTTSLRRMLMGKPARETSRYVRPGRSVPLCNQFATAK